MDLGWVSGKDGLEPPSPLELPREKAADEDTSVQPIFAKQNWREDVPFNATRYCVQVRNGLVRSDPIYSYTRVVAPKQSDESPVQPAPRRIVIAPSRLSASSRWLPVRKYTICGYLVVGERTKRLLVLVNIAWCASDTWQSDFGRCWPLPRFHLWWLK